MWNVYESVSCPESNRLLYTLYMPFFPKRHVKKQSVLPRNKDSRFTSDYADHDGLAFIEGHEQPVNLAEVMMQLGVEWTVRFHQEDFSQANHILNTDEGIFTHFNLGSTNHKIGKRYAFVPILKPGVDGPPLVDYTRAITVVCSDVADAFDYAAISENDFKYSLPTIQNTSDLQRAMCERYCAVRHITKQEVLTTPVTITTFRRL